MNVTDIKQQGYNKHVCTVSSIAMKADKFILLQVAQIMSVQLTIGTDTTTLLNSGNNRGSNMDASEVTKILQLKHYTCYFQKTS